MAVKSWGTKSWRIDEFLGIDQSRDGSLLHEGTSPDTVNMDTANGNLTVANGYVKHIDAKIPGSGIIRRICVMKLYNTLVYAVLASDDEGQMNLYAYDPTGGEWHSVYKYPEGVDGRYWDMLQCNIGNYDYMLIACGEHQMVKWDGINAEASLFGSGETAYESKIASYSNLVLTLEDEFSKSLAADIKRKGLVINEVTAEVEEADYETKKVTLKKAPSKAPAVGGKVTLRGGVSDAPVNYLAMHYSRLFAAGDPNNPSRLYYSQIAGDGRGIEDWSKDDNSANTSGGFIEVGDSVGDPIMGIVALSTQLLIIKRYSMYRLLGDRPANFTVERVDAQIERLTHTSVVTHKDIAYYLTPAGLYYFDNINAQPMADSKSVYKIMRQAKVSQSKSCEAKGQLYFTLRLSCEDVDESEDVADADYDDAILVYDTRRRTYMLRDGFNVADLISIDGVIYMVNDERYLFRFNEGHDYDGRPISARWMTQRTDWRSRAVEKRVDEIYLSGECGEGEQVGSALLVTTIFDNNQYAYHAKILKDSEKVIEIRPRSDWARTFQFAIENEVGSRFTLTGGMEVNFELKERPR